MDNLEFEIEKWKTRLDERFRMFVGYYESDELKATARHFFELGIKSNQSSIEKDMEKKIKFMKWAFILTAVASAIVFFIIGAVSPIEAGMSKFGHVLKTFFMWFWVTAILETFMYTLGQFAYHWMDDYKELYGDKWFVEGIKADFKYIKEQVTWRKVLKYVLIYAAFFAACLLIFGILEYLVP